ncbi:MAG TPA: porin family protein [Mucilaginibacter sp.]|jgi:hypothetical protein|nr:porin family protein [Mucilaginibacter sp.]
MKKIFLAAIAMFACVQFANAQRTSGTQFSASIGINGSQITDANYNSDAVAGLNLGVAVDQYFSHDWSINVGLNYQQKGWANGTVYFDNGNQIDGVDFKLHYLTVPVLANLHFGYKRNWYVDFGPYIGFLLSASESSNTTFDTKSYFNSVDGGVAANIGVKIPINRQSHFFIEFGGQGGLANVVRDANPSLQNITTSLNVGIGF